MAKVPWRSSHVTEITLNVSLMGRAVVALREEAISNGISATLLRLLQQGRIKSNEILPCSF